MTARLLRNPLVLLLVAALVLGLVLMMMMPNMGLRAAPAVSSNPVNDGIPECQNCRRQCECTNGRCICGTKCEC